MRPVPTGRPRARSSRPNPIEPLERVGLGRRGHRPRAHASSARRRPRRDARRELLVLVVLQHRAERRRRGLRVEPLDAEERDRVRPVDRLGDAGALRDVEPAEPVRRPRRRRARGPRGTSGARARTISTSRSSAGMVDPVVEAPPLERVVQLARAVRRHDRRPAAPRPRSRPISGIVTANSERISRRNASNSSSARSSSSTRSTAFDPARIAASSGRSTRNSGPNRSWTWVSAVRVLHRAHGDQLPRVVPLVQRLARVDALVALQADQIAGRAARRAPSPPRSCRRPPHPPAAAACRARARGRSPSRAPVGEVSLAGEARLRAPRPRRTGSSLIVRSGYPARASVRVRNPGATVGGIGVRIPSASSRREMRSRSSRSTSNRLEGRVSATTRTIDRVVGHPLDAEDARALPDPVPQRGIQPELLEQLLQDLRGPGRRPRRSAIRTSTIARAQPRDLLLTTWMFPFGTRCSVPSKSRSVVTRRVSASTLPLTGAGRRLQLRSTSPTPNWFSSRMKNPESVSRTIDCAPNPSATPATPALAKNGPSGTSSFPSTSNRITTPRSTTQSGRRQRARQRGDPLEVQLLSEARAPLELAPEPPHEQLQHDREQRPPRRP